MTDDNDALSGVTHEQKAGVVRPVLAGDAPLPRPRLVVPADVPADVAAGPLRDALSVLTLVEYLLDQALGKREPVRSDAVALGHVLSAGTELRELRRALTDRERGV